VVSGKSGQDAATVLRTLIERRERVFDEFGELFEAHQIDASSIATRSGPRVRKLGASRFTTDGRRVK
jgi:hypothetical protein